MRAEEGMGKISKLFEQTRESGPKFLLMENRHSAINLEDKMTGWELAKQVREIEPSFSVVYMTGAAAPATDAALTTLAQSVVNVEAEEAF